ncbi:MAG: hypothetical protein FWD31_11875 [Planctomycetaceae bacterium]|nr:hypothetical protein [Planctomycetaceae bacterium]
MKSHEKTEIHNAYEGFLQIPPPNGDFQFVDVSRYVPCKETDEEQPKIPILDRNGAKTKFWGLSQIDPDSPWEELMANDTRTRELTADEFAEWSRRSLWKATRPTGAYRACPHAYCVSTYEDSVQRYEFECAARSIHDQGRGMIFTSSRNVWAYHFPGDGFYYWKMNECFKQCDLINRVAIATVIFLRKKEDPDWFNGRDDMCLRTHSYGTFLERFGFDRLARYHNGIIKPIEIRRFGAAEVKVYDFDEVTA